MGLSELGGKLVEPARWIVIMGIAFTLANSVLFFIAPPENAAATNPAARQAARTPDTRPAVSINAILNRNLFGIAGESAVADSGLPAVETRLPLELLGVFVADNEAESAAIVAQKGKAGLLYVVGEKVPGNAELLEVHADHIVLRRAGNRETLRFPQVASTAPGRHTGPAATHQQRPAQPLQPVQADPAAETPREFVASYRERIEVRPGRHSEGNWNHAGQRGQRPGLSAGQCSSRLALPEPDGTATWRRSTVRKRPAGWKHPTGPASA